MALGGIAAGFVAARRLVRDGAQRTVRTGLLATAAASAASTLANGPLSFAAAAAALGAALGAATVGMAGGLASLAPREGLGRAAGLGTGLAYLASNVPLFFTGSPAVRAWVPALACLAAAALVPRDLDPRGEAPGESAEPFPYRVAIFALLVVLDSAAFAAIQHDPGLLAASWGGAAHQMRQGAVHLAAALVAGLALDRGRSRGLLLVTAVLFAVALPGIGGGLAISTLAAAAYAAGISFYSTALVVAPSRRASRGPATSGARAAWLFALAGWVGSGVGVGLSQRVAWTTIAAAALPVAAAVTLLLLLGRRGAPDRLLPTAALAAVALAIVSAVPREEGPQDPVARGREVYLEEGCQHCHSQYVRPGSATDETWWGPHRPLDRGERPPTPGNRRIGPDLSNVGLRRSAVWQELHLRDPRSIAPGSRMPSYAHLFAPGSDRGPSLVAYLGSLGAGSEAERWREVRSAPALHPAHAASASRGHALFERHCAACHGATGRGDGPALVAWHLATLDLTRRPLRRVRELAAEGGEAAALERVIRFGLPPWTMAGHEWLSDQEVADLASWVRSLGSAPEAGAG